MIEGLQEELRVGLARAQPYTGGPCVLGTGMHPQACTPRHAPPSSTWLYYPHLPLFPWSHCTLHLTSRALFISLTPMMVPVPQQFLYPLLRGQCHNLLVCVDSICGTEILYVVLRCHMGTQFQRKSSEGNQAQPALASQTSTEVFEHLSG